MEKVGERNEVGVTFLPPDYTVLILTIGPEGLLFGCRYYGCPLVAKFDNQFKNMFDIENISFDIFNNSMR